MKQSSFKFVFNNSQQTNMQRLCQKEKRKNYQKEQQTKTPNLAWKSILLGLTFSVGEQSKLKTRDLGGRIKKNLPALQKTLLNPYGSSG
jgi:hypothetical protein